MPAGSNAIIDVYTDSSSFTIPSGYVSFVILNSTGSTGYFNGGEIKTIGSTTMPYVGTTYGEISVDNATGSLVIFAIK